MNLPTKREHLKNLSDVEISYLNGRILFDGDAYATLYELVESEGFVIRGMIRFATYRLNASNIDARIVDLINKQPDQDKRSRAIAINDMNAKQYAYDYHKKRKENPGFYEYGITIKNEGIESDIFSVFNHLKERMTTSQIFELALLLIDTSNYSQLIEAIESFDDGAVLNLTKHLIMSDQVYKHLENIYTSDTNRQKVQMFRKKQENLMLQLEDGPLKTRLISERGLTNTRKRK